MDSHVGSRPDTFAPTMGRRSSPKGTKSHPCGWEGIQIVTPALDARRSAVRKPPPPVEEEKKEPGQVEKTFQQVKDGSRQAARWDGGPVFCFPCP